MPILLLSPRGTTAEITREFKPPSYQTREIEGWTIHFNETLFSEQKREVEIMLPLLHKQLAEIVRVVPPRALAQLRAIPIWVSPTYPNTSPKAEYHPGAEWLREHGRNPAMVKAVEITNVRTFAQETDRMPNFLLHELAHGYHDRVLSFQNREILEAYEHARANKLYDRVERWHGSDRPTTIERAYALVDHKEYFAEQTEAYFVRNDFYPFTRRELQQHDPKMFQLLERLWAR